MNLMDLVSGQLNDQSTLSKLGQSSGADSSQVQQLMQLGLPVLMQALGRNASTNEGAQALTTALDKHQDADLSNVAGFLDNVDTNDGAKILQHILAGNNDRVQNNLASQTGLDTGQVGSLLAQLAPVLMGALGQQKKTQNLDASGIAGLLSNSVGQSDSGIMALASKLLDTDNDGSIIDDVGNLLGKLFKK